ncbi:MAG: thioredoxin domain-containing protein [Stenotrophobium sp.]
MRITLRITLLSFLLCAHTAFAADGIAWQPWSDKVFTQAAREHKLVLLDLEAVWCHWCHVMDQQTYCDPAVIKLLHEHYLAIKVDQDARPDLSNRYEDYGWPATIVYDSHGAEIVKRSGFIPPLQMSAMLQANVDDPTPGPSVQPQAVLTFDASALTPALRATLSKDFIAQYDTKFGSWGFSQKFLDWDSVEYALVQAQAGDDTARRMAQQTLTAELALLDPAWGGVYQYSTDGDWQHAHFEKIMSMQANNLRIYALASMQWHDPADLHAALAIRRYLKDFLTSPDGAFYTSQDADLVDGQHSADYFKLDDAARRKLGIPRVDKHIYARENGWAIEAVATLYAATGDNTDLQAALKAAHWVITHRSLPGNGFRHDAKDAAGPYLGDTLAMGRAFLQLYAVTADRDWLVRAQHAADFISQQFAMPDGAGYATASQKHKQGYVPQPLRDENAALARFANLLFYYTGKPVDQQMAKTALRYLAAPAIAERFPAATVLLVDHELSREPVHLTVVGAKSDATARALFEIARSYPSAYKRVEWWARSEGPLPNPDVPYPDFHKPAAFICTAQRCSSPLFSAQDLQKRLGAIEQDKNQ